MEQRVRLQATYKELKRQYNMILTNQITGLQATYKELKHTNQEDKDENLPSLQATYKELKPQMTAFIMKKTQTFVGYL